MPLAHVNPSGVDLGSEHLKHGPHAYRRYSFSLAWSFRATVLWKVALRCLSYRITNLIELFRSSVWVLLFLVALWKTWMHDDLKMRIAWDPGWIYLVVLQISIFHEFKIIFKTLEKTYMQEEYDENKLNNLYELVVCQCDLCKRNDFIKR